MDLLLVRHLWGLDLSAGPATCFAALKAKGYGAIEAAVSAPNLREIAAAARGEGLDLILQVFSNRTPSGNTASDHLTTLQQQIRANAPLRPRFFNAHSGSDRWDLAEAEQFYTGAIQLEQACGFRIAHETHRGRFFFTPWSTAALLARVPGLSLSCDFSHWVCVAERLLPDCAEEIALAARHCLHVHARVGFEEGPQVPDPRAPEYQPHLEAHEAWWRSIWNSQRERGFTTSTLAPEFGPPFYLHTKPGTREPLADLEEICDWMAAREAAQFASGSQRVD